MQRQMFHSKPPLNQFLSNELKNGHISGQFVSNKAGRIVINFRFAYTDTNYSTVGRNIITTSVDDYIFVLWHHQEHPCFVL